MSWWDDISDYVSDFYNYEPMTYATRTAAKVAKKALSNDDGGDMSDENENDTGGEGDEGKIAPVDYAAMYEAMADMYGKISAMNEEKFNKYWPASIKQGIAAGKQFDIAGQEAATQTSAYNMGLATDMNNWLGQITHYFNAGMRGEAAESNKWIMGQVEDVNKFNSEEFYKAMENAMPGMQQTAGDYKATVDQMLSGQLPDVVKSEIAQTAAERGLSAGTYGPSQSNAQLRDLGISRLQYLQAGQAQMPNLMALTQAMTAPVASPNIYQNVMMTPTPYTPQPSYATPSNIPGIAGNYLSAIMGGTMMQPQAGIQAAVQMGGIQAQQNLAQAELQYSNKWSQMNYNQQQSMFDQQMSAQREQRWWDLAGGVLGVAGMAAGGYAGGL